MAKDQGKMTQARVVRCVTCAVKRVVESTDGKISTALAERWIRKDGWSKSKFGLWSCPACMMVKRDAVRLLKLKAGKFGDDDMEREEEAIA